MGVLPPQQPPRTPGAVQGVLKQIGDFPDRVRVGTLLNSTSPGLSLIHGRKSHQCLFIAGAGPGRIGMDGERSSLVRVYLLGHLWWYLPLSLECLFLLPHSIDLRDYFIDICFSARL